MCDSVKDFKCQWTERENIGKRVRQKSLSPSAPTSIFYQTNKNDKPCLFGSIHGQTTELEIYDKMSGSRDSIASLTAGQISHSGAYCIDHSTHVLSCQCVAGPQQLAVILQSERDMNWGDTNAECTYRDLAELHSLSSQLPQSHLFLTSPLLTSFLPINISQNEMTKYRQYLDLPLTKAATFRAGQYDLAC